MAADPRIRASDDDRDRTASLLREHHAAGRLTPEEFSERLDQTFAAKTVGDLDELLSDLPAIDLYRLPHAGMVPGTTGQLPATTGSGARPGRFSPGWQAAWGSWFTASAVLIVIWVLAGLGYPWFAWIVAPWGVMLLGRWISGGHPDGRSHQHGSHQHGHHQPGGPQHGPGGPGSPGELPGGDQDGTRGGSGPGRPQ